MNVGRIVNPSYQNCPRSEGLTSVLRKNAACPVNILVCLKQILDPEVPPRDFAIDDQLLRAKAGSAGMVTNIFCENALETALQLREQTGGEMTALTVGPAGAEDTLRKALALKVDHACLVEWDNPNPATSAATALLLSAAIEKLGTFDLVMVGREAGDWGAGQTGALLAEHLGLPFVAFVDHIEPADGGLLLHRQTDIGSEKVQSPLPVVVSITNSEENFPRIPKTRDIMLAHRKPLTNWSPADLGVTDELLATAAGVTRLTELFVPQRETECDFIDGDTVEDKVTQLAERMAGIVRSL